MHFQDMSLDKKIYLATALGALAVALGMAIAAPRFDLGVVVHAESAPPAPNALVRAAAAVGMR